MKKQNAYVFTRKDKTGRYNNLYASVTLNNGQIVTFEIKEKWYNAKFNYKLKVNLPSEANDNEKK